MEPGAHEPGPSVPYGWGVAFESAAQVHIHLFVSHLLSISFVPGAMLRVVQGKRDLGK